MRIFRFAEPVWVIGFKSEIYDSQGEPPRENYLCHTFLSDMKMRAGQDEGQYKAVYSDAFTREVRLPDGFGMRIAPNEDLYWTPIFNNRRDRPTRVGMNSEIIVVREKDLKRPLRRLYTTIRTVDLSHLFFVPPGRASKSSAASSDSRRRAQAKTVIRGNWGLYYGPVRWPHVGREFQDHFYPVPTPLRAMWKRAIETTGLSIAGNQRRRRYPLYFQSIGNFPSWTVDQIIASFCYSALGASRRPTRGVCEKGNVTLAACWPTRPSTSLRAARRPTRASTAPPTLPSSATSSSAIPY